MTGWTEVVGWTLLHFVWQGALIALLAAIALRLLRGASAQVRYAVASLALIVATMAPLVTAASYAGLFSLPSIESDTSATTVFSPTLAVASTGQRLAVPVARFTRQAAAAAARSSLPSALPLLVGVWLIGVVLLTGRLAMGLWRIRALRIAALAAAPSTWSMVAKRIASRLGVTRAIHVVDVTSVDAPTVIGWLRPVILLPVAALANLTASQVEAILAHELAHIRRHDFAVNVLQMLAETLLFYHPAVWWISSRIRIEREHCCDDLAVEVCGDTAMYVEALAQLAAASLTASPLAVAATGGSLLDRARRLLLRDAGAPRSHVRIPFVIAVTVALIVVVGMRFLVIAQSAATDGGVHGTGFGPADVNTLIGYDLFPPRVQYVTDDPGSAVAWDVKVSFPGGEMPMIGFTGRKVIRYAYGLHGLPLVDGPAWLDTESLTLHATTPATEPKEEDFRLALRLALEQQYGLVIGNTVRQFPVYRLVLADVRRGLGPNIHPSTVDCLEGRRERPVVSGPHLVARGQLQIVCGVDNSFNGPYGYRVTMAEFARSLRQFPLDASGRELFDATGLAGAYDYTMRLGPIPLAAIATLYPNLGAPLRSLGIQTFPAALRNQLGLKLEPGDASYDVVAITAMRRAG